MYYLAVQQFGRTLRNLDAILVKAEAYAATRQFDINNFCSARLAPDMAPFVTQIQIACDTAKLAAAKLSGKEAPRHEDTEKTFPELRERIKKCVDFLESLSVDDFQKASSKTKVLPSPRDNKWLYADDYLFSRQIPNFFFHVSMAYALLRKGGVDIGKADLYGSLPFVEE